MTVELFAILFESVERIPSTAHHTARATTILRYVSVSISSMRRSSMHAMRRMTQNAKRVFLYTVILTEPTIPSLARGTLVVTGLVGQLPAPKPG